MVVDDRVTGATGDVLAAGVVLGMPRREAEALAPFATVLTRDVGEEARRFESVVTLVEDLVPRVEVVSPGLMFVPVAGAVRYYGGEEELAQRVSQAITDHFLLFPPPASEASVGGGSPREVRDGGGIPTNDSPPSPADAGTPPAGGRDEREGGDSQIGREDRMQAGGLRVADGGDGSQIGGEDRRRAGAMRGVAPPHSVGGDDVGRAGGSRGVAPPQSDVPPHYLGIADGPFAARWAAAGAGQGKPLIVTDTIGFLSGLDLGALRESMGGEEMIDTFRWLGIATLGDLARLPRETLASRFGNPGLLAHRLASGEDRLVEPRGITVDMAVEMSFEDPLESFDSVAFAGRNLAEKLLGRLRSIGVAPHAVTITAEAAYGPARSRVWRSADPFTGKALTDRVWWQLRAWVEASGVPGGITALRIVPDELSGEGRQMGLFTDESSLVETERALASAQAMLGPDGVLQARAQGGRMPAERVAWSRWGEPGASEERDSTAPWPGATPRPAPALVPPRLDPIEVEWDAGMPSRVRLGSRWEPVLTWSGPWRLSGRWWDGERDADRYQLVTSVGAFLCVVAEGRAFLAGIYD